MSRRFARPHALVLALLAVLPAAACSETPAPREDRISSTEAPAVGFRSADGGAAGDLMIEGPAGGRLKDGSRAAGQYQFVDKAKGASPKVPSCPAEAGRRSTCP